MMVCGRQRKGAVDGKKRHCKGKGYIDNMKLTFCGEFCEPLTIDFHVSEKPLKVVVKLSHHSHCQNKPLKERRRSRERMETRERRK